MGRPYTYIVRDGDTLSAVARRSGTTVGELQRLNGISNPDLIQSNQSLALPTDRPSRGHVPPAAQSGISEGQKSSASASDTAPGSIVQPCDLPKNDRPLSYRVCGDDNIDAIYIGWDGDTGSSFAGGYAKAEVKAGLLRMDHAGNFGDSAFGGSHKLEFMTAEAKGHVGGGAGVGAHGAAGVRLVKEEASLLVGPAANPYFEAGAGYEMLAAEAKGGVILGTDGEKYGFMLKGSAKATPISGDLAAEANIPIPFMPWTISLRGKTGLAAEAGAGGHLFYDTKTSRAHFGGALKALVGIDVDLSIGKPYEKRSDRPDVLYSSGGPKGDND